MKCSTALAGLLVCASAQAQRYEPGTQNDPRLRSAYYLAEDQRHLSALSELLAMDGDYDWQRQPPDYQWALAQSYVDFGLAKQAEKIYRSLAITTTDHLLLARSRLRLAELLYQRGYLRESRETLEVMRAKLPEEVRIDWQDLLARVLMADNRYGDAVGVLSEFKNADEQTPYTRYNLGVALISDGQVQRGRDVLERVGRLGVIDLATLALRDRANLTLGWHFLKNDLGGSAKPIFYRVRSQGPFSNRALLGLGWAELAPRGDRQRAETPDDLSPFTTFATLGGLLSRPGFLDDATKRTQAPKYKLGDISGDEQDALQRAMVAWVELISRDPMDPAVQEAWLAIPYSLDRHGAHVGALQYYEKSVAALEDNRKRILTAEASIQQGRMVETIVRRDLDAETGWEWKLKDLPDAPETYYLQDLLASHRFQEALKNYRDIRLLSRNLDAWLPKLQTLELAYAGRPRAEDVDPAQLFKAAVEDASSPYRGTTARLRLETEISAPGSFDERVAAMRYPPMTLRLGSTPRRFNGPYERMQTLRARQVNLREQLAIAGGEQARLLQKIALNELRGQKKTIEKYLVESRFALARLYDRAMKDGKKPEELQKDIQPQQPGLLDRFLDLFGAGK